MKLKLLKAAGMIGALTLLSRILGMIRDIASAHHFGTSWQWDAFIYAFMLPNFLRRLVGEGALSSAFIPVYADLVQKEGRDAGLRFANVIFTILTASLIGFVLAAELILFFLVKTPSLPPVIFLTVRLLEVLFPYLLFISLCALSTGLLNSHQHFFSPSLGPILLDIIWIAGIFWVTSLPGLPNEERVFFLAFFILVAGAVQLAVQIPALLRVGFSPRWIWDLTHPGLIQVGKLILPALLGFAIVQTNVLVDMTLGFWVGEGANSSLFYGNRLMQFPLGVFAIAMGTALLPAISRHTARKEMEEAKQALSFGLRSVFFIILPATVGLIVLRTPIVRLLFERGEFDAASTARTAMVTLCYTIGLFAYSGQKIVVTGFYSLQDTKTPMKIGAMALVLNLVFNLLLMLPMREAGLALATSIAGIFNFLTLLYLYQRKISDFPLGEIFASSIRILIASLVTGGFAWLLYVGIYGWVHAPETVRLLAGVLGSVSISSIIYFFLCFFLRVPELRDALDWLRKRNGGPKATGRLGEELL